MTRAVVVAQVAQRRQNHCQGGWWVAVVAEWRHSGRHMLSGRYWLFKGGPMVVQGRQKHCSNWYTMFTTVRIVYGATNPRPLCIHSATTAMCVPSSCLLCVTCEWPTSSTFVRLFWTCSKLHGDHGVHGDVWTSCVPPLNDQGNRSASFLPSTATWPVLCSHNGGRKVAAPV